MVQQAESVRIALASVRDLREAAIEIARSELPISRLGSISREAGELLKEAGVVETVDDGVVLFHSRLAEDRPALGRILRRVDVAAGRIKRPRRSKLQRAYTEVVRAGLVTRDRKTGRIKGVSVRGRKALKTARSKVQKAEKAKRLARQKTALKKLKGIGG